MNSHLIFTQSDSKNENVRCMYTRDRYDISFHETTVKETYVIFVNSLESIRYNPSLCQRILDISFRTRGRINNVVLWKGILPRNVKIRLMYNRGICYKKNFRYCLMDSLQILIMTTANLYGNQIRNRFVCSCFFLHKYYTRNVTRLLGLVSQKPQVCPDPSIFDSNHVLSRQIKS